VIQFIMDVEHVSFHEAVEQLANRVGMAMPQEVNDAAMMQERAKRERLAEACQLAARFYMENLLSVDGVAGRAYLKKRKSAAKQSNDLALDMHPANGKH
jgi:DNA primase